MYKATEEVVAVLAMLVEAKEWLCERKLSELVLLLLSL